MEEDGLKEGKLLVLGLCDCVGTTDGILDCEGGALGASNGLLLGLCELLGDGDGSPLGVDDGKFDREGYEGISRGYEEAAFSL